MPACLRLAQTPGLGPVRAQALLARFGTAAAVLEADHAALCEVVPASLARLLCAPPSDPIVRYAGQVRAWLAEPGNHLLSLDDPAYPRLLRAIAAPPPLLYVKGDPALLDSPAVAIVGSRNATQQGQASARAFAGALSQAGMAIVSGLALGIDAAAHEGALRAGGVTVAVVGTGADRIYPRRNADLARAIAAQGCVASEYPLGMGPLSGNFPQRNRIISGLCRAVLVVEAAAASGSLITAHVANEQGRDVFAIPGSIHAPLSKGCHRLIKEGATLVESIDDLLEALQPGGAPRAPLAPGLSLSDDSVQFAPLLLALGHGPMHGDALAGATDTDPGLLSGQLLALELAGQVERLPGGLFQRIYR